MMIMMMHRVAGVDVMTTAHIAAYMLTNSTIISTL